MITFEKAIEAAQAAASAHVDASASREIREGWFFPYRSDELLLGSNGIIVNKQTGACFMLGSAYPVERDLKAYDEGFRFASYDLTITRVNDEERTLNMLLSLRISTVEPKVAYPSFAQPLGVAGCDFQPPLYVPCAHAVFPR